MPSALLQCVSEQSRLRTNAITPNENKTFSIVTMLMVDDRYEQLNLDDIIDRLKEKGIPIDPLVRGMLAYNWATTSAFFRPENG